MGYRDIEGFNQSEAQISLCSRFALRNKTNIQYSPWFTKRKTLGMKVIKYSDPSFIRYVRVFLGSHALPWE